MREKQDRFIQLMEKYQVNTLSNDEYFEYIDLLNKEDRDDVFHQFARDDWASSKVLLKKIQQKSVQRKRRLKWTSFGITGSVLILLGLYMFWSTSAETTLEQVFTTTFGETKSIELPDGSKVLLNANSTLTWDASWEASGKRKVLLEGEAFFNVVKTEDKKSFTVDTKEVEIKVLGTSFNVRSRAEDTDVYLRSGKVDLAIKESAEKPITMMPGDLVSYDKVEKIVLKESSETLSRSASWVNGMLEFENKNLQDILHRLEELYGIHFLIENKDLINKRMDLSLPYSNWELIKQAIEISLQVDFTEENNTIIVK